MATKTVRALNGGTNNHPEPVFTANSLATDFISPGVVGAITLNAGSGGTGGYAVNAEGSPTMQVRVSGPSVAYVTVTPTGSVPQLVRVDMSTFEDVTINANASGSTKFDWLYISVDPNLALNPDVNATTVATLFVSRSSSSASDNGTPPSFGYNLAVITVANGAVSIINSNISDKRIQTGPNALSPSILVGAQLISNPYKFGAYRAAAWTDGNGGYSTISFDTKEFDTNGNFDVTTNVGRYTATGAGWYQFNAGAASSVTASSFMGISIFKNGSAYKGANTVSSAVTTNHFKTVSALIQMAVGDFVTVGSFGTGGAGVVGQANTYFSGFLVSTV